MVVDCNLTAAEYAFAAKNGEAFSDEVIREILWKYTVEKEASDIDNAGRWQIGRTAIVTFDGVDFYRVYWWEGSTEYQDDEYESQVLEPVHKVHKVIEVDVWEAI